MTALCINIYVKATSYWLISIIAALKKLYKFLQSLILNSIIKYIIELLSIGIKAFTSNYCAKI